MRQATRLPTLIGALYIYMLLLDGACAKSLFGLRVESFIDVVNNNRKDFCYEKTNVLVSNQCQKSLHLYLLGGPQPPMGTAALNNSEVKLGQTVIPMYKIPNEASIPIDGALPTSFTLVAELQQSTLANNDAVLLARFVFSRNVNLSEEWLQVGSLVPCNASVFSAQALRIAVRYRVRCSRCFYGPTCQIYCEPRDDALGHYTCRPNGERECLPGWTAPKEYCNKPVCVGCHSKGGKCEAPNQCRCQVGWHGTNCSECQRYAGCDQGYCVEPNECRCNAGWVGRFCNHEQAACRKMPCLNGATCVDNADVENATRFECKCPTGFTGTRCELRVTSTRATSTSVSTQKRPGPGPSYPCNGDSQCNQLAQNTSLPTGKPRKLPCHPSPCRNGATCLLPPRSDSDAEAEPEEPFVCVCRQGYTGTRCETLDFDPHLCQTQRNCFDPNRCTVRLATNGVPQCVCAGNFAGYACDVINCTRKPCLNGGHCVPDDGLCRCKAGYNGTHCEVESNRCLPNPCAHGICDQVGGSPFCDCFAGWTGETCNVSLFGSRFSDVPGAFAVAIAHQPTEQTSLISPALFWAVIAVCVVLIVVLLVITKFLITGIRKKQRLTASGASQLHLGDSGEGEQVQSAVDHNQRLHAHLVRRHSINNLNDAERDAACLNSVKQLPSEEDPDADVEADASSRLLGGLPSTGCSPKFGTTNYFNPNLNSEKILPAKHILSFATKADMQNHSNAARLNSAPMSASMFSNSPLPVRCPSPPNWNAHPSILAVHSVTPRSSGSMARQSLPDAYDLSTSYNYHDTGAEASAYRATGNSSFR